MDNKLNLGSEIRELKLGSSFTNPSSSRNNFHTLKCEYFLVFVWGGLVSGWIGDILTFSYKVIDFKKKKKVMKICVIKLATKSNRCLFNSILSSPFINSFNSISDKKFCLSAVLGDITKSVSIYLLLAS